MTPIASGMSRLAPWLESAWMARYLERQLSADETAWFEAYVLDKPDLLTALEADTDLRDALHADAASRAVADPMRDTTAPAADSPGANATARQASPRSASGRYLGLAASLLLGVGIGVLVHRPGTHLFEAPVTDPMRIVYDTMRGERTPPHVERADSSAAYAIVEVAVPPSAHNIVLTAENATPRTLHRSAEGFVSFLLPRNSTQRTAVEFDDADRHAILPIEQLPALKPEQ